MAQGAQPVRGVGGAGWLRITGAAVLAVLAGVIVWLIVKGEDDHRTAGLSSSAAAASLETLHALPGEVGHPVYWAGEQAGYTYELTEVKGNIFIRYLPPGVQVGDPRPNFLTIGTYPTPKSYAMLKRQSRRRDSGSRRTATAGIAVWSDGRPQSVYVSHPRSDIQIEVYDPSARRARRLAVSGAVEQIRRAWRSACGARAGALRPEAADDARRLVALPAGPDRARERVRDAAGAGRRRSPSGPGGSRRRARRHGRRD